MEGDGSRGRPLPRPLRRLVFGPRRSFLRRERSARGRRGEAFAAGHAGRMDCRGDVVLPPVALSEQQPLLQLYGRQGAIDRSVPDERARHPPRGDDRETGLPVRRRLWSGYSRQLARRLRRLPGQEPRGREEVHARRAQGLEGRARQPRGSGEDRDLICKGARSPDRGRGDRDPQAHCDYARCREERLRLHLPRAHEEHRRLHQQEHRGVGRQAHGGSDLSPGISAGDADQAVVWIARRTRTMTTVAVLPTWVRFAKIGAGVCAPHSLPRHVSDKPDPSYTKII